MGSLLFSCTFGSLESVIQTVESRTFLICIISPFCDSAENFDCTIRRLRYIASSLACFDVMGVQGFKRIGRTRKPMHNWIVLKFFMLQSSGQPQILNFKSVYRNIEADALE